MSFDATIFTIFFIILPASILHNLLPDTLESDIKLRIITITWPIWFNVNIIIFLLVSLIMSWLGI